MSATDLSKDRLIILAMSATALAALSVAWVSQYVFGLNPCILCLYQRTPYIGIVALGALSLLPVVDGPSRRLAALIGAGLFLTTAGLGAFHFGVEQKWWEGFAGCSSTNPQSFSLDDIQGSLLRPGLPFCDEIQWQMFGISMAGYNVLAGLAFAALTLKAVLRRDWWQKS